MIDWAWIAPRVFIALILGVALAYAARKFMPGDGVD